MNVICHGRASVSPRGASTAVAAHDLVEACAAASAGGLHTSKPPNASAVNTRQVGRFAHID